MLRWLWVTAAVIGLDRLTKLWASHGLHYGEPVSVMPLFNLTLAHNTGAAFSMLAQAGGWQRWLFAGIAVVVSTALCVWLARMGRDQRWLAIAVALVLGGALGNLYDRVVLGYVIDFLDFYVGTHHWPAFNIADSAITVGAVMLVIDSLWSRQTADEGQGG